LSPQTRNLTILLTDIKGFTDKTSHRSRADIQAMLDTHKGLVLPLLEGRGGKLIKTMGDAFLMVFESPTDAVLAGVQVQDTLLAYNKDKPADERIEIRIAINQGEVNLADNDIFGEPVNITARIEGVAEAGEVFFTEAVYLAMNKSEVPSSEVGLLQLKGIPEKVRVYKVKREQPVGVPAKERPITLFPAGTKAVYAGAGQPPKLKRRALALMLDLMFCGMIADNIDDALAPRRVHEPAKVEVKAGEVNVESAKGKVRVKDGKVEVEGDEDGDDGDAGDKPKRFPIYWVLYNGLFLIGLGMTPGKKIFKLRVETLNGARVDPAHALARSALSLVSGSAVGLGYAWAGYDKDQRTWHDMWSGTRVVSEV
jgi:class 3 adenylate cyclase